MATMQFTGDYITEAARNMVLSENWRGALRLLTEDIEGMSYQQAVAVLKGELRLSGAKNIELIEEDAETFQAYAEEVRSVYRDGRLIHDGKRYKLYAKASALPGESSEAWIEAKWRLDTGRARFPTKITDRKSERDDREFILPWCTNKQTDLIFPVEDRYGRPGRVYAVFELDAEQLDLPVWMTEPLPTDPQVAFDSVDGIVMELSDWVNPGRGVAVDAVDAVDAVNAEDVGAKSSEATSSVWTSTREGGWHLAHKREIARSIAIDAGFPSVAAYSQHLRQKVLDAIDARGDTWKEFTYEDDDHVRRTLRYPERLANYFSVQRTKGRDLVPDWEPVSEPDLKMNNDNRVHTDLWLALGFDLDGMEYEHGSPENVALYALTSHLQKEIMSTELHVLTAADQAQVSGLVVRHDDPDVLDKLNENDVILWVPHAGEEFQVLASKSVAVLCNAGGKLAHLVLVGRETGIPVVRIPEDAKPILVDAWADLDLEAGKIQFREYIPESRKSRRKTNKP